MWGERCEQESEEMLGSRQLNRSNWQLVLLTSALLKFHGKDHQARLSGATPPLSAKIIEDSAPVAGSSLAGLAYAGLPRTPESEHDFSGIAWRKAASRLEHTMRRATLRVERGSYDVPGPTMLTRPCATSASPITFSSERVLRAGPARLRLRVIRVVASAGFEPNCNLQRSTGIGTRWLSRILRILWQIEPRIREG